MNHLVTPWLRIQIISSKPKNSLSLILFFRGFKILNYNIALEWFFF